MFTRHVSRDLARYADGDLAPTESRVIEAHLAGCDGCRAALAEYRFAAGLVRQLSVAPVPAWIWTSLEHSLPRVAPASRGTVSTLPRIAFACALVLAAVGATIYWSWGGSRGVAGRPGAASWEVSRLDEAPALLRMAPGEWVRTDASSRARIKVGEIGTVDVEPSTRVRLGQLGTDEFRIALEQGTIGATINAPPRLFIVDTPTSTVVDLGCAYTMHVGEDGSGELRVTSGWTSLEWKGRESLVPAGAQARTRPGVGPGTPFFEDASARLREAITEFDFQAGGSAALEVVLSEARVRDTLTLWHLLWRVNGTERARVYDRIAELTPPPATVSREKALRLDPATLKAWREELAWSW
jgi:predicted anti-sigma-YlaC factor YlaD